MVKIQRKEAILLREYITELELNLQRVVKEKGHQVDFLPYPAHPVIPQKRKLEEVPGLPRSKPGTSGPGGWGKGNTKKVGGECPSMLFK